MRIRLGINGFGVIGRNTFRALQNKNVEIVRINDRMRPDIIAHLIKYHSGIGESPFDVKAGNEFIEVNGRKIPVTNSDIEPDHLDWKRFGADVVLESTGLYNNADMARGHIKAGATKVLIAGAAKKEDITVVSGVNYGAYNKAIHNIISVSSFSTNCIAPVVKVIHKNFGIERGSIIITRPSNYDETLDERGNDKFDETDETSKGYAQETSETIIDLEKVLPQINGKISSHPSIISNIELSEVVFSCMMNKHTTVEEVNNAIKSTEDCKIRGVLGYSEGPVSREDFKSRPNSCIFDSQFTKMLDGNIIQTRSWYAHGWGYANRISELIMRV